MFDLTFVYIDSYWGEGLVVSLFEYKEIHANYSRSHSHYISHFPRHRLGRVMVSVSNRTFDISLK